MLVWALLACGEGKESAAPPPLESSPSGDTGDCAGASPVINGVEFGSTWVTNDDGTVPGVELLVHITDDDGDIHRIAATLWFDDEVDGVIDTTSDPGRSVDYFDTDEDPCTVEALDYLLGVGVNGSDLEYDTHYEVAVVVMDDAGLTSNVSVAAGYTPNEDGTPGGE